MGRTGKSNVERRSVEKRPSLRSKLRLPWKELQGSWEVCLFFWFLLLSPWTPASRGSPMETPSQNCHTMLLPNNGTAIGQVWNKPLLIFHSVSIENRVQVKKITYHSSLSRESLTRCKEHDPGSCGDAKRQAPNQLAHQKGCFLSQQGWRFVHC